MTYRKLVPDQFFSKFQVADPGRPVVTAAPLAMVLCPPRKNGAALDFREDWHSRMRANGFAGTAMREPARKPNDLERLFLAYAKAGDVEGLVSLYETNATLVGDDGEVVHGIESIRQFFVRFLAAGPQLNSGTQATAVCSGDMALTSSRLDNGVVTAEIARRQPDGNWLWVVDRFALVKK